MTRVSCAQYIKNLYNSVKKKTIQITQFKKCTKNLDEHFYKKDIQKVNMYMKRCMILLVIRKMQIETTLSYHLMPIRMVLAVGDLVTE